MEGGLPIDRRRTASERAATKVRKVKDSSTSSRQVPAQVQKLENTNFNASNIPWKTGPGSLDAQPNDLA